MYLAELRWGCVLPDGVPPCWQSVLTAMLACGQGCVRLCSQIQSPPSAFGSVSSSAFFISERICFQKDVGVEAREHVAATWFAPSMHDRIGCHAHSLRTQCIVANRQIGKALPLRSLCHPLPPSSFLSFFECAGIRGLCGPHIHTHTIQRTGN